jgi:octaprenyl-diphosphate synthase
VSKKGHILIDAVDRKMEQFIEELEDSNALALYKKLPQGKKLRTKLIFKIAGESSEAIDVASAIEMIHLASLLHDDVIDNATTRRGKISVNASDGNKSAIMLGDILYSKAFYELTDMSPQIAKIISNAVVLLSLGELADVKLSEEFHTNKEAYLKMLYQKTASLMEASAEVGAILANKNRDAFREYGKNLGIAFQMIDDILDITADSKTLGKPALHDFMEGKVTLPYIYLYESLDESEREYLKSLHKKELNEREALWIKSKMREKQIIKRAYTEAKSLVQKAIELMDSVGEEDLGDIAKAMIEREF